ncbi:YcxB family protein [bacterium]|nr:YcxB family protein [bacterium]
MQRVVIRALAGVLLALLIVGCGPGRVKRANVWVSYETVESAATVGVVYGPQKVRRLEITPDYFYMYYDDHRAHVVPNDEKLKWFKFSESPEE